MRMATTKGEFIKTLISKHFYELNHFTKQEHTIPAVTHADYLPDVTGPDAAEGDYEQEEDDQGPEEEYDDYQEALHPMD